MVVPKVSTLEKRVRFASSAPFGPAAIWLFRRALKAKCFSALEELSPILEEIELEDMRKQFPFGWYTDWRAVCGSSG